MNPSMKEQLATLFGLRNEAVHGQDVVFSKYFLSIVEQYDINLDELRAMLIRGMRPGRALRKMLEARLKSNAQTWADREGLKGPERDEYVKGFMQANGGTCLDGTVKELTEAFLAKSMAQDVLFAKDSEDIRFVYANGPGSCMVDPFPSQMAGLAYGFAENLAIAYRQADNGKITARTLVNTATRKYGRVYGDEATKLYNGLGELGYNWCEEEMESPANGELLFIPLIRNLDEQELERVYHPPYIDWSDGLIATEKTGHVWAWGKKWYGRWMRPFKFWSEDQIKYDFVARTAQMNLVLKDAYGRVIGLEVDEIPEAWEFHSRAREATPLYEDEYFKRIWNEDPYLKYAEYDR